MLVTLCYKLTPQQLYMEGKVYFYMILASYKRVSKIRSITSQFSVICVLDSAFFSLFFCQHLIQFVNISNALILKDFK